MARTYKDDLDVLNFADLFDWLYLDNWSGSAIQQCADSAKKLQSKGWSEEEAVAFVADIITITKGEYGS